MNNKGFTLVEVIVVIALLGLVIIISSTNILGGSKSAKEKMLETKIHNIEKAAVLYGQDYRHKINKEILETDISYEYCFKELEDGSSKHISNCYYYEDDGVTTITVGFLADNPDGNDSTNDAYIEYDDKDNKIIKNPVDENMNINNCKIQIYQKYGKIYAVYDKTYTDPNAETNNTKCWTN